MSEQRRSTEEGSQRGGGTPELDRKGISHEVRPAPREVERANRRATLALFGGIVAVAAVGIAVSAIVMAVQMPRHHRALAAIVSTAPVARNMSVWVAADWKKGPDGKRHDAYSQTNFTVRVGQPVRLRIDNRDDTAHSITAAAAGVNIVIQPGVHTYTLLVRHSGRFQWICASPCDPFAMGRPGYMAGYITAS